MPVTIRRARPADHSQVIALIRALAEFEKLPGPDEEAAQRLYEHAFGPQPRCELLVADDAGEIVGYAVFFATYSTFLARPSLFLEDLFVRADRRSGGIGQAFLRHLAGLAVERGCGRFEWSVLDWNVRAQDFYRGIGAQVLRQWWMCRVEAEGIERLARGEPAAPTD